MLTFHHSPICPARDNVHVSAEEEESPEARVATLTASLATLAAEKSRTESAMQEDRKKLISERREREREAEALRSELAAARSASRDAIQWILATFGAIFWAHFGR